MNEMKKIFIILIGVLVSATTMAQLTMDEQRMKRDIEVAENVLSTLFKQQFERSNFFPLRMNGTYEEGYGVTFRLPGGFNDPMRLFMMAPHPPDAPYPSEFEWTDGPNSFSYSFHREEEDCEDCEKIKIREKSKVSDKSGAPRPSQPSKDQDDSEEESFNDKFIEASKNFLADYGDLLSQLRAEEKIMITNRDEGHDSWFQAFRSTPHTSISIEAEKGDLSQEKQGKITRDQLLAKIKVSKNEVSDKLDPDLELLSSIFERLYQPDLAKTYFTEGGIRYERLKDLGVTYFMKAYSSRQEDSELYSIPALALNDLDQDARDKKVKEMYPAFEKELKENMLDYGRTLKSLKDNENFTFNVKITRCKGCEIPSSLELSIKNSTLKDFSSGKISKESALTKIAVKKGPDQ